MLLKRKEILLVLFFTLIIATLTYVAALYGDFAIYYYLIIPLIIFLVRLRKQFIIILYLIILPTSGIIPSTENILGAIGLDEIINIIAIFTFFSYYFKKIKLNINQKNVKSFLILLIILAILENIKNAYFNIYGGSFFLVFKRFLFITVKFLPLFFIIQFIYNSKIRQYVILGIYISGLIIVVSQIFNEHLLSLNFSTIDDSEFSGFANSSIDKINRFSGFYNGDPNSSGTYLLMLIAFILTQIKKFSQHRKYLYALVLLYISGILITASRTVITSFVFVLLMFTYYNKSRKISFQLYLLFAILCVFGFDFLSNQLSRFHNANLQADTSIKDNRIMKWAAYIKFMIDSPIYFITGSQEEINVRSAHNVYVQMLYNIGIIPLLFFLKKITSSFKLLLKQNKESIYFIVPFFFITIFVGELSEVPIFLILFILITSETKKQNINSNIKIHT